MLWKEIADSEDCDLCPVKEAELCCGGYNCYGGAQVEPPCCMFDDDTDIDEWISEYENWKDSQIKSEKAKQEKTKKAAETRREMRWYCLNELQEIKSLEKALSAYESQLSLASSFAFAFNTTNEMFRCPERLKEKPEVKLNIERMKSKIQESKQRYEEKRKEFYLYKKEHKHE